MAAVNSWILYQKVTGSRITRREYTRQLSTELTAATESSAVLQQATAASPDAGPTCDLGKCVNCQVKTTCRRNRTVTICESCKRPVCVHVYCAAIAWQRSTAAARTMRHSTDSDMCTMRRGRLLLLTCGRVNKRLYYNCE